MEAKTGLSELRSGKMKPSGQLATLLGIKACINGGDTGTKIVTKFRSYTSYWDEQESWDKVSSALKSGSSFPLALAQSGLFEEGLERIFTVTEEAQKAVDAAIEFLSITLKQP